MPNVSFSGMKAAVYRGKSQVVVEEIARPEIGPGEILIRVESCGICHTDLKKIEYDLLAPPRIYGHETAGVVAEIGAGVTKFAVGDRVVAFHHIPCGDCFYCARRLYAQCPGYKRVGITAGFEAAGGGFAQYVRVMDWIVERGVEKIPDGVSFDAASFVEPVNTCVKGVALAAPRPDSWMRRVSASNNPTRRRAVSTAPSAVCSTPSRKKSTHASQSPRVRTRSRRS